MRRDKPEVLSRQIHGLVSIFFSNGEAVIGRIGIIGDVHAQDDKLRQALCHLEKLAFLHDFVYKKGYFYLA